MAKIIEISNVSKIYSGNKVVDDLTFDVEEGEIVGLIGPNGAGKSTTMKIILGLIAKDSGTISIQGNKLEQGNTEILRNIGFTAESPAFYNYLTGFENLKLIANMYTEIDKSRIEELLKYVGLEDANHKKVKNYSTGMKQRLGIARALISNPKIIILDEPTNGLDPQGMRDVYYLIQKLSVEKRISFIISSHLLHDIEKICSKIVFINKGKTIYNGTIDTIKEKYGTIYRVNLNDDSERAGEVLGKIDNISVISLELSTITIKINGNRREQLESILSEYEISYSSIQEVKPALEDLFFIMTKEG